MTETIANRGERAINPYLHVKNAAALIDFYKRAFGAQEGFRGNRPDGSIQHAELTIGNSLIELGDTPQAMPMMLHYYVDDCDAVYNRAIQAGAVSLRAPVDQSYGDRDAGIQDPIGNYWWIATRQGSAPSGMGSITIWLNPQGANSLIDFAKQAFDAQEVEKVQGDDGSVRHAILRIANSVIEVSDAREPYPATQAVLRVFLDDVDGIYERALAAGATSLYMPADQPYGERFAGVTDQFGNIWYICKVLA